MKIEALYNIYLQNPSVQTDTRKIQKGDLFFALKGPSFDGNTFTAKALELGAAYAIVDDAAYCLSDKCILVADVLTTLQALAAYHRAQFSIPFIAITGSNGKTTSKELLTTVLRRKGTTYATEGNLNNHIGVPLTILKIKKDAAFAIIEMGANHQKEIESYCKIAQPNFAIINNCGKAHLEGFGGIEGVRKGKGELYDYIRTNGGLIFRNTDLAYLADMAKGIDQQITYGTANADYTGRLLPHSVLLSIEADTATESQKIESQLVGDYNFANILLAVAVGRYFGVGMPDIKAAIESYIPDNSRSQLLQCGSNQIILDAYNANPTSMRAAIQNFAGIIGDKILCLGAMKEMGDASAKEHEELVAFVSENKWNSVILVGQEFEAYKGPYHWFATADAAAQYLADNKPSNSFILIKGSRGSKMEKVLEVL